MQFSTGLKAGDPGSTPALDAVPAIRRATTAVAYSIGAADSAVGGQAPALYDISAISNSDLIRVIPIAILAIGLLLALVLRSLVAPLYLIASVALSYLAALGLSVLLFIDIGHSGGLVFFMPFLMFIFLLALGEDYNILVMTRIREEAHRLPLRDAVARALSVTGTTVTSAGLVLAGTFVVFGAVAGSGSGGSQFRDIAIGLALGILMDTFLVRTLLVPSTVVLLGRWNWWPSRMSRVDAEHAWADWPDQGGISPRPEPGRPGTEPVRGRARVGRARACRAARLRSQVRSTDRAGPRARFAADQRRHPRLPGAGLPGRMPGLDPRAAGHRHRGDSRRRWLGRRLRRPPRCPR